MLNMDTGGGRVILAAACGNKTSDGVVASNQFPAGLRVLVVDDDPTCLKILERMLRNCLYEVATCTRAIEALSLLRERKFVFDLVLSDVHMPDMDGFKLLEHIGLEMDLPVIMMSVDDKKEVVMKGVTHGACDYLIKPIRIEAIKNIWQHVVRKRKNELKELEQSGSVDDIDRNKKADESDYASSANEGSWKSSKRRKEEEDEVEERDDTSNLKKPRVVWSVELHQQFVGAVNQLGIDKAVPKKILELMNVPGLTRENVASHLQKYRLYLRRLSGVSQHPSGLNMPFMGSQDANYGPLSSLEGFDLQSLVVPTQIPPHSLATLQAGGLTSRPTTNTGISMTDHRNPFSNETSTLKFAVGQELNGSTTQVNIFHGRPTNVEPKQLPHLHQSIQLPGSGLQIPDTAPGFLNLPTTRMSQSRSRGQLSSGISGDLPSGLPISVGQQMMSNEMASQALGRNVNVLSGRGAAYNSGLQSLFDVQVNNTPELPGNSFPLGVAAGLSSLQSTGMFQDRRNSEVKRPRSIPASYDTFNEFQQGKPESWELQNDNSTFDPLRHAKTMRGNPDFSQAISSSQGFSSAQKSGRNQITSMASNAMASLGENQFGTPANFQQHYNYLPVESLFRIKTENNADFNSENMFQKHLDQEDLMSSFLKQQEAVGLVVESGPNFDGYQIDDIQA